MKKLKKILVLAGLMVVASGVSSTSHASVKFSVFGSGVYPQTVSGDILGVSSEFKGKLGFGGGAALEVMLGQKVGLEFGGTYMIRKIDFTALGATTELERKAVYIPAGLRIHLSRAFSIQLGGFYDLNLESADDPYYGLQGGVRVDIPLGGTTSLFVDARYNYSLKEVSGFKFNDLVLASVGIAFGGKGK